MAPFGQHLPLVGRERDLAALRSALDAAIKGRCGLALISGEAGIGKTTLLHAIAQQARAQGGAVHFGHCYDLEANTPYGPWREVLTTVTGGGELPAILRKGGEQGGRVDPEELRAWAARAIQSASFDRLLVIGLEDLHWADEATVDLLRHLARQASDQKTLIIGTYRESELASGDPLYRILPNVIRESRPLRVALRPLDRPSVERIIATRYQLSEIDAARLTDYVCDNAEGNPFFIDELLNGLEADRVLEPDSLGWRLAPLVSVTVPMMLRQVIDARLGHLDPSTIHLLQVAAVIGRNSSLDLWQRAAGCEESELVDAIDEAIAAQVLVESTDSRSLMFRHALIRRALYERLSLPRRQVWHYRVGSVMAGQQRADVEVVANHFWQAADPQGIEWSILAGDRASRLGASSTALVHFTRAIELAERKQEHVPGAALCGRAAAASTLGRFSDALADYEMALSQAVEATDLRTQWEALIGLGTLWGERDYARVGRYMREALELAQTIGDPQIEARSQAWLGNWHLNVGEAEAAVSAHHKALAIYERIGDELGMARTRAMLGMDHLIAGNMDECQSVSQLAAVWFRDNQRLRDLPDTLVPLMSSGGVCSFSTESPAPAYALDYEAVGLEAIEAGVETGWRAGEAFSRIGLATYFVVRGRYGEALQLVEAALATSGETGHRQWEALGHITIGELYLDIAAFDLARQHLARGLALAREIHSFIHVRLAVDPFACLLASTGDYNLAETLLDEVLPSHGEMETAVDRGCWRARAHLELARENPSAALEIADRVVEEATNGTLIPAPELSYIRGLSLAKIGATEEADRVLAGARADAEARGYLPVLWKICAAHADVLGQLGRQESARRAVGAKAAVVSQLAASIPDESQRHAFMAFAGITESPAGEQFAGLSEREMDVLRLTARGKTNSQIAEELFISPRTVKGHLESVYTKLDVDSRTAAAARAIREGWL